jgi:hypothetical protein
MGNVGGIKRERDKDTKIIKCVRDAVTKEIVFPQRINLRMR